MASKGIINPNFLFVRKAPPKSAIAAIGVKLGGWGSIRLIAAIRIATVTYMNLGVIIFDCIVLRFIIPQSYIKILNLIESLHLSNECLIPPGSKTRTPGTFSKGIAGSLHQSGQI